MDIYELSYEETAALNSSSKSVARFSTAWADRATLKATLLGSIDANNANLICTEVIVKPLGGDYACGFAELTANFTASGITPQTTDPFKFRLEFSSQAFTISGKKWRWSSSYKPLSNNVNILPIKQIPVTDLILYGRRSGIALDTYDAYEGKVNDDEFLGAPAGTVLFLTGSAEPVDNNGTAEVDVQLKFQRRGVPWNQFFNEDTGKFEEIEDVNGKYVYDEADFSGLLA